VERSNWIGPTGGARAVAPGFSPLDEALALGPGPWTPGAREAIVRLGTVLPFEQVPALLASLCGVPVSVRTVCTLTEAAGAALCTVVEADLKRLERELPDAPQGAETQQVSVDGAMVPIVGGSWREVRTLAIGRVRGGATGEVTTDELSYFCRMRDAERFAEVATGEVHRRGVERTRVVAAVADGAPWCQGFFDLHVPDSVRILDFPHAVEHLGVVAHAVFWEGSAAADAWLATQRHDLRHGVPGAVLNAIVTLPVETASNPDEARTTRDREAGYFRARREQIAYAAFSARGLPIGSGAVESANKLVVEARLKRAGMHWAPAHVDPMLALHGAHCSRQWETAWTQLCQQQRKRFTPVQPAVTTPAPVPPPTPATIAPPRCLPRRATTIVNGRPTKFHPWKQGRVN
jgi:hypothetical protein